MFIPCFRVTSEGLFFGIDMDTKKMLYQFYSEPIPMVYGGIGYYKRTTTLRSERNTVQKHVGNLSLPSYFKTPYMGLPYLIVPYCDRTAGIALTVMIQYVQDDSTACIPVFNTHLVSYSSDIDFNNKINDIVRMTQGASFIWHWSLDTGLLYYYEAGYDNLICTGTNTEDIPYHRLLPYAVDTNLTQALKQLKRSVFMLGGSATTVILRNSKNLDEAKRFSPVISVEGYDPPAVMTRYNTQSGYALINHVNSGADASEVGYTCLRDIDSPFSNYILYDNTAQVLYTNICKFAGNAVDNGMRCLELNSEYYPMELNITTEPAINTTDPCNYYFDLRKCKYIRKCLIRAHFSYTEDVSNSTVDLRGVYCDALYVAYKAQFDTVRLTSDTYMLRDNMFLNMHFLPLPDITADLYGNDKLGIYPYYNKNVNVPFSGGVDWQLLKAYNVPDAIVEGYESSQKLGRVEETCGLVQARHIEVTITRNFTAEELRLCTWSITYDTCTIFYDSTKITRDTVNLFSRYLWSSRTVSGDSDNSEFALIDTAGIYPPSDSVKLVI